MKIKGAVFWGTILSCGAIAGLEYALRPYPPVQLPPFQWSLSWYWALASLPTGNGLEPLAMTVVIMFACFYISGRMQRRR